MVSSQLKNRDPLLNEYNPDYVAPLSETLLEVLESRNMTIEQLAFSMEVSIDYVNNILNGTPVTEQDAAKLETILEIPASFWRNRQMKNHPDVLKAVDTFVEYVNSLSSEEFQKILDKQEDGPFTQMYKDGFRLWPDDLEDTE